MYHFMIHYLYSVLINYRIVSVFVGSLLEYARARARERARRKPQNKNTRGSSYRAALLSEHEQTNQKKKMNE